MAALKTVRRSYEDRLIEILPMINVGVSRAEVGKRVGLSQGYLSRILSRAKDEGHFVKPPRKKLRSYGFRFGNLGLAIDSQGDEFKDWLAQETAAGATISELAVSAMVDVFYEETEKEE